MGRFNFRFSRRCIAVDLGQSRIKAILVERTGQRVEVLHAFTLDLQEEGLLTPDETNRHINRILREMGDEPLCLVIPQHIALSHLIALPSEGHGDWERMIEEETQKLTGLSDSTIVYDHFRLKPSQEIRNPVWVTVGREKDLETQIKRLQGSGLAVEEVINTGNALASTYLSTNSTEERVVLVDVGAASTTVVVLEDRQPVYATSFPFGGELFTEAVASARNMAFDDAEMIKKTESLFVGDNKVPSFVEAVERWHLELHKVIAEWLKEEEDTEERSFMVMLSGGASLQSGFVEHLRENSLFRYEVCRGGNSGVDLQTYAVAYGAALAGVKLAPVRSSLLPKPLRQERSRAKQTTLLNSLAAGLLAMLFFVLLFDTSVKRQALGVKKEWITDLNGAYAQIGVVNDLLARRNDEYNKIVPIAQQQKQARDLLKTLGLMQEIREENDVWFVLLADGRSYLEQKTSGQHSPNWNVREGRSRGAPDLFGPSWEDARQTVPWNRFVAEVTVPGSGRETHDILRNIVNTFSSRGDFQNVDTLPAGERQPIVNPDVTLPDQTFSLNLNLELATTPFSPLTEEGR